MRQEHFDLGRAHIARVAPDGEDKPPHPIVAGVFSANAEIQPADTGARFIRHSIGLCCAKDVIDGCFKVLYNL
jgi:hypothetical protein